MANAKNAKPQYPSDAFATNKEGNISMTESIAPSANTRNIGSTKYDRYYLDLAERAGENSVDPVFQVGCIIVNNNQIIADGWNGTPTGYKTNDTRDENGETLYCTVHAESNALAKCARHGSSCDGGTMYINIGPCPDCAKFIVQAGIKRVVYARPYRSDIGPALLEEMGVTVCKMP